MKKNRYLLLLLILFFIPLSIFSENLEIAIGITEKSPLFAYWRKLFNEIEIRSNSSLSFELKPMSLARCRQSLINAMVDGDAGRTELVYENIPGIIKIDPPLFTNRYYAFAMKDLDLSDIDNLEKIRLATISGNLIVQDYVSKNNLQSISVNENEDALRMILYDRVDCLIATDLESPMLDEEEFKNKGIIMHPQVIFSIGIYLFISENKQHLATQIENILSDMSSEGLIDEILRGEK